MVPMPTLIAAAALLTFTMPPPVAPGPAPPVAAPGSAVPGVAMTGVAMTGAAVTGAVLDDDAAATWEWPLQPAPAVVRRFEVGPARWSAGHRGADLAARPGAPVLAPADGVVHFAGAVAGRPVLSIAHPGGRISSVEPVTTLLRRGDPVVAGARVGTLAALPGHCAPAACLHWGVRVAGTYVDPLQFVRDRPRPIVLKPLAGFP